jgi:succinoglycan biosynthesis transport protein ExoP
VQAKSEQQEAVSMQVVWTAVRCWWMIAGPIAVCLACGAGYAVYALTPPNYTASVWLEIREQGDSLWGTESAEQSSRFVDNQLQMLTSPSVITEVTSHPKVGSTPELVREANPVAALRKLLKVRRQGKSDYYVVEFTSQIPSRAALIPTEVAKSYKRTLDDESKVRKKSIIDSLRKLKGEQQTTLEEFRKKIADKAKEVGAKDPYGLPQTEIGPTKTVASELNAQLAQAEVNHEFLKAEVAADKEAINKQPVPDPKLFVDSRIDRDPRILELLAKGEELQKTEQELADAVTNPQKHPKVVARKKEIAKNKSDVEKMRKKVAEEYSGNFATQAELAKTSQIAELDRKLKRSEIALQHLQTRRTEELENQAEVSGDLHDLDFLKSDYERTLAVSAMVADRLYKLENEPPGSDRVRIREDAVEPKLPDQAIPYKKILMAALGAFAIPFGCAVAYEVLHQRVNCRKQLETLDVPCSVTEIAALPSRSRALLSGRREDRLDLFIESVDGLRTSLMVPSGKREVRVFAVTSAIPGEGKTSLSTQFALSLASATGEPTLLIDGDLRYPDVHNAFEIEQSPGLADVFDKTCAPSEAIVKARGDNLFVLPAGELVGNPHRVTANGRFRELIGELRTHFKYIVIDTPPILPASEALVMAKAADATLLVARRDHSRLDLVKEASQKIVSSGSRFAGVVLSGVPSRDYQYRYGAYGYGNGRHS